MQEYCNSLSETFLRWDEMKWDDRQWSCRKAGVKSEIHSCGSACLQYLVLVQGTCACLWDQLCFWTHTAVGRLAGTLLCALYNSPIAFHPHGSISSFPYSCFLPFSLFPLLTSLLFLLPVADSPPFLNSFFLSSLIYLFRANFQIYKPITAKRLCWGSLWACRCGGSWIPITELIWKKTLSVMWKWFGLRLKFIIITLISSQASALAAAKENTKA